MTMPQQQVHQNSFLFFHSIMILTLPRSSGDDARLVQGVEQRDCVLSRMGHPCYFFSSGFAVGGTSPFRRRYIAAIP
jgi:hypothetical protein